MTATEKELYLALYDFMESLGDPKIKDGRLKFDEYQIYFEDIDKALLVLEKYSYLMDHENDKT